MKKLICLLTVLLALSGVMVVALAGPILGGDEATETESSTVAENERPPAISPARQQTKNSEIRRIIRQESEE